LTAGHLATALTKTAMGLRSKEAENPVLFKRAEILDNLDQRFVSVKGHYQADSPSSRLPKEEAGGVEMLLLNGNVLDAFAQFIAGFQVT